MHTQSVKLQSNCNYQNVFDPELVKKIEYLSILYQTPVCNIRILINTPS